MDYSFCYLSSWELDRNDGMIGIKCNIADRGAIAYASISTMAFTLEDSSMLANAYWDSYRADLTELYGDKLNVLSEKAETKLGNVVANRNRYTVALSDVTYTYDQIVCVRNGVVYLVTRTLWAPMLLHAANNAVAYLLIRGGLGEATFSELLGEHRVLYALFYALSLVVCGWSAFRLWQELPHRRKK